MWAPLWVWIGFSLKTDTERKKNSIQQRCEQWMYTKIYKITRTAWQSTGTIFRGRTVCCVSYLICYYITARGDCWHDQWVYVSSELKFMHSQEYVCVSLCLMADCQNTDVHVVCLSRREAAGRFLLQLHGAQTLHSQVRSVKSLLTLSLQLLHE